MPTPLLDLPIWEAAMASPHIPVGTAHRRIEAFAQPVIVIQSAALATPPGSPNAGEIWYIAASPTGAWAGHAKKLALWSGTAWELQAVRHGWLLYNLANSTHYKVNGSSDLIVFAQDSPYDVRSGFINAPNVDTIFDGIPFVRSVTFADDFSGSYGFIGTNPTATYAIKVNVNGSTVGTISISTAGVFTFATTGGALTVTAGQIVTFVSPNATDATIKTVMFNLRGTVNAS